MTTARRGAVAALAVVWFALVLALSLATARLAPVQTRPDCAVVARSAHVDGLCLDAG